MSLFLILFIIYFISLHPVNKDVLYFFSSLLSRNLTSGAGVEFEIRGKWLLAENAAGRESKGDPGSLLILEV